MKRSSSQIYGRLCQTASNGDSPARNCFPLRHLRIIPFVSDVNPNILDRKQCWARKMRSSDRARDPVDDWTMSDWMKADESIADYRLASALLWAICSMAGHRRFRG